MSTKIVEAYKKMKKTPNLHSYEYPITSMGPFRGKFQFFLQECAEVEEYTVEGMSKWSTLAVHKNRDTLIPLYTIEEKVKNSVTDQSLSEFLGFAMPTLKLRPGNYWYDKDSGLWGKVNTWSVDENHCVADDEDDITYCYRAFGLTCSRIELDTTIKIQWEMIRRKFFVPNTIPNDEHSCQMYLPVPEHRYPALTPLLFLYHPDNDYCELYDPYCKGEDKHEPKKEKGKGKDKPKKVKGLNLRGFKLVGSSLGGLLLLLNQTKYTFCCYDLSLNQWHILLESENLTPEKDYIGVTDGVGTIILLELQDNGVLLIHPFEVLEKERVIQYPGSHHQLKGKVTNAMLSADGNLLCFIMKGDGVFQAVRLDREGGTLKLRERDLLRCFRVAVSDFTCLVPSLWSTLLIMCFTEGNYIVYEATYGEGRVKKVKRSDSYNLNQVITYLVPDGVGTLLFPHPNEEGGDMYLSTTQNSDCLLLHSSHFSGIDAAYTFSVKKICQWPPAHHCACQAAWVMVDSEPE